MEYTEQQLKAIKDLLYKMADDRLIIGHRNSEWTGLGPVLEEDIAFSSIAQDKIGQSLALYNILHSLGEDEPDIIAFTRNADKFRSELQGMNNVVLTPHIGGSTMEAQENIGVDVANKLLNFLETGTSVGSLSVPALNLSIQHDAHRLLHIHKNVPGVLSEINAVLSKNNVNILGQYLKTNEKIGYVVLDIDKKNSPKAITELNKVKHTIRTRKLY